MSACDIDLTMVNMKDREDSSSPTGILEDYFRSSDSETCSSKEASVDSESRKSLKAWSRWRGVVKLLTRSKKPLTSMNSLNVLNISRRMSCSFREIIVSRFGSESDSHSKSQWKNFALFELQIATNYFRAGL